MLNPLRKDPWPRSHWDLIEHYYAEYDRNVASGKYRPFLYPWGTLGALVVIIYLLIPHQNRPWLKNCRFLVFAWIVAFAIYSTLYTRAKGMAPAFGVGLISAWSVVWVSAILICNDAQTDFQRIERLEGVFKSSKPQDKDESSKLQEKDDTTTEDMTKGHSGPTARHGSFAWQPYPLTPFIERLDWVLDIFCNFRGAGWNWRTSALPPPPKAIQEQLRRNSALQPKTSNRTHAGQVKSYASRAELLRANLWTFVTGYVLIDAIKTLTMHDPYFWGLVHRSPPTYFPFTLYAHSPTLTHISRLLITMLAIKTALRTLFALGPLFFCGLLSPALIGARAEYWVYPESWASYLIVLDKGLAGWWGSWWHQTFRFAFQEPSRKIIEVLGVDPRSAGAKAGQLAIAFALSGLVHACGSWTAAGESYPISGPFAFFMVQAAGIFVESSLTQALKPTGLADKIPRRVKQVFTFVYVHVWFYFTAHMLCDDFTRCGIWLFEPVPISLFRGLGFGADKRDGWWCWWGLGNVIRWHVGETWLTTGVAF
jgi:hypothetical protein